MNPDEKKLKVDKEEEDIVVDISENDDDDVTMLKQVLRAASERCFYDLKMTLESDESNVKHICVHEDRAGPLLAKHLEGGKEKGSVFSIETEVGKVVVEVEDVHPIPGSEEEESKWDSHLLAIAPTEDLKKSVGNGATDEVLMELIRREKKKGHFNLSLRLLQQMSRKGSEVYYEAAHCFYKAESYERAMDLLKKKIPLEPMSLKLQQRIARKQNKVTL